MLKREEDGFFDARAEHLARVTVTYYVTLGLARKRDRRAGRQADIKEQIDTQKEWNEME